MLLDWAGATRSGLEALKQAIAIGSVTSVIHLQSLLLLLDDDAPSHGPEEMRPSRRGGRRGGQRDFTGWRGGASSIDYCPRGRDGPSWLSFIGHTRDSCKNDQCAGSNRRDTRNDSSPCGRATPRGGIPPARYEAVVVTDST